MSSGIKIVKSGKDVSTATASQFVINSLQPGTLKIATTMVLTITTDGVKQTWTVSQPHNLGYVPAFFATVIPIFDATHAYKAPYVVTGPNNYRVYADSTNIYANILTGSPAFSWVFNIVVFKEKITG